MRIFLRIYLFIYSTRVVTGTCRWLKIFWSLLRDVGRSDLSVLRSAVMMPQSWRLFLDVRKLFSVCHDSLAVHNSSDLSDVYRYESPTTVQGVLIKAVKLSLRFFLDGH